MQPDIYNLLKTHFGYDSFRDQQAEIIQNTLQKNDSLIIMPTGGGKSICYQLPAFAMEGMALVISPLIALMKDQVEALRANGLEAASLNSTTEGSESREIAQKIKSGKLKLLYVSPERAVTPAFIDFIKSKNINLIAIDEAHCVSMWGNDFRPVYTQLPTLLNEKSDVPFLALTATADKATQQDIAQKLELRNPKKYLSSFERKNLQLKVLPAFNRLNHIIKYLEENKDASGIVYCLSRKSTEELATKLNQRGFKAAHYHATVDGQKRHRVQEAFQKDEIRIICATIAFGMGIDNSNIRFVFHYNLPKNIESYYQEMGRAGRDGLNANTTLFFNYSDVHILKRFIDESEGDDTYKKVQTSKLFRMVDFCQATSCRTNMILSYFGEHRSQPCGHCDNCQNPPQKFDGTRLAQMAMSASKRLNERVAINMLTDILRGANRHEISQLGFDRIKTYGAGKDYSREQWLDYISQMINLGLYEVDYTDYNKLKVTPVGGKVLFENEKVELSKPREFEKALYEKPKSKTQVFEEELMGILKSTRQKIASSEGVPTYVIFNDATLEEMVEEKPLYKNDLLRINGVGDYKLEKYGDQFIEAIQSYVNKGSQLKSLKGKTYLETRSMLKEGLSPEEIAKRRNMNLITIYSHVAYLYEKDEDIRLEDYITADELDLIEKEWLKLNQPDELKPLYEKLEEKVDYYKLRLTIAHYKKKKATFQ